MVSIVHVKPLLSLKMLWSNAYNVLGGSPSHIQSPLELPVNGSMVEIGAKRLHGPLPLWGSNRLW